MLYRIANQFLEIWYQSLDSWMVFLLRCPSKEDKEMFRDVTIEMMENFIETLRQLDLTNLETIEETKDEI